MSVSFRKHSSFITEIPADNDSRMIVPGIIFSNIEDVSRPSNDQVIRQVMNVAMMPGIMKASMAMPDYHWGYGFPIGGVAAFRMEDGIVSPGGVGYDINCGVSLLSTPVDEDEFLPRRTAIMDAFSRAIPVGMERSRQKIKPAMLESIIMHGLKSAVENGIATKDDLMRTEDFGEMRVQSNRGISDMARKRGVSFLGTLGSGNHFLEVQKVSEIYEPEIAKDFLIKHSGQIMVMIHSGSRGLGHQVATEFMSSVRKSPERIRHPLDGQLDSIPVGSEEGMKYIDSMSAAANYGYYNRQAMISSVRDIMCSSFNNYDHGEFRISYGISHNIAREERHIIDGDEERLMVHRKGSTRAFHGRRMSGTPFEKYGHPVLVPGDMGTSSYVLVGTERSGEISLGSSCHGAGREMSRKAAAETFDPDTVMSDMEKNNIMLRAKDRSAISTEAPGSYKNIDKVIRAIVESGIAKVVARLSPVGVLKG